MSEVFRIYSEKRGPFAVEAAGLLQDIRVNLRVASLTGIRILNRYDVEGISKEVFDGARDIIFSEPQVDVTHTELPLADRVLAVEYLPGQYDQRADSCAQCIQILTQQELPAVRTAKVYLLEGTLTGGEYDKIRSYLINPVESREASLEKPESLREHYDVPTTVETVDGFITAGDGELRELHASLGLAMDEDDLRFCRDYFKNEERRDPTITELRMLDTYWSDHCRHTTFMTELKDVSIESDVINLAFQEYLNCHRELNREKPVTLMDVATLAAKVLKERGILKDLDESEEINACSVKIKARIDGGEQDWLLMFKNETHNHPTEIEPFGGAATCLGGAIRDPLSGRAYVYQAMRVTGAADPRVPVEETLPGKLPQRKITTTAAAGYSSYGNQIGLATGHVHEIYHPGYVAKRMEIGAVVGAAPAENVVRERPAPGDVVLLLGGATGRDGCGGATGSSKSHTLESLASCGAEVQKGNPPEERKLQRLFRRPEVTRLIKRCNDFGAGGVSVAVGELADGLLINLDAVPRKYEGLTGTELAISESQERMAVVVRREDAAAFIGLAASENLRAVEVAVVTEEPRLRMTWNGNTIVDISRAFIDTSGATRRTDVSIPQPDTTGLYGAMSDRRDTHKDRFRAVLSELNVCSQKGLVERFDSSIGANTVVMPYGGKHQLTPAQYMAAKLPVLTGNTTTASLMAWGFDPYVSERSPFHGAVCAVVESLSKLAAAGADYKTAYLTFQEYFERTKGDPSRWGKPLAALLGAFSAQLKLGVAAIGGKDSMSGSFEDIDVPPTLVSFAVAMMDAADCVTPEFKTPGSSVWLLKPAYDENALPDYGSLDTVLSRVHSLAKAGRLRSAWALGKGGVCEAVSKMCFGNGLGFAFNDGITENELYGRCYGGFVLETADGEPVVGAALLGRVTEEPEISLDGETMPHAELLDSWQSPLEGIFPVNARPDFGAALTYSCTQRSDLAPAVRTVRPRVLIPVFPGTNCEYDTARSFEAAGAEADILVFRNLTPAMLEESLSELTRRIEKSQIVMLPGGFSGGDEPDGSGKFIAAVFRNPRVKDAVHDLLKRRDGLMLGICNGFQALIKLGLVPYGEIVDMTPDCPTLTYNQIGRHQSMLVRTRISSVKSPWLSLSQVGDVHLVPVSHGEGRFVASVQLLSRLAENGQIATQYVDLQGRPSMDIRYNPNGSVGAVEGILSPDGRVLGKMAHSERCGEFVAKNVAGGGLQPIFEAGVRYFR